MPGYWLGNAGVHCRCVACCLCSDYRLKSRTVALFTVACVLAGPGLALASVLLTCSGDCQEIRRPSGVRRCLLWQESSAGGAGHRRCRCFSLHSRARSRSPEMLWWRIVSWIRGAASVCSLCPSQQIISPHTVAGSTFIFICFPPVMMWQLMTDITSLHHYSRLASSQPPLSPTQLGAATI